MDPPALPGVPLPRGVVLVAFAVGVVSFVVVVPLGIGAASRFTLQVLKFFAKTMINAERVEPFSSWLFFGGFGAGLAARPEILCWGRHG